MTIITPFGKSSKTIHSSCFCDAGQYKSPEQGLTGAPPPFLFVTTHFRKMEESTKQKLHNSCLSGKNQDVTG